MLPSKQQLLARALGGSPADCMEWAKKIVGDQLAVEHRVLAEIGSDKSLRDWPRIAAIYALGLIGEREFSAALADILADTSNSPAVRGYAAEALGNIGDKRQLSLLKRVRRQKPSRELAESVDYALEELSGHAPPAASDNLKETI